MYKPKYYGKYAKSFTQGVALGKAIGPVAKMVYNRVRGQTVPQVVVQSRKRAPRRRPYRKRRYKKANLNKVKKDVAKLKKQVKSNTSTYIKKYRIFQSVQCSVAQCAYLSLSMNNISNLQSVINSVKYFDPATPATLIDVDLSAPTFQNQVRFTKSFCKGTFRNNYVVPVRLSAYILSVKKDTNLTPETNISNSIADFSNGAITSPLIYPTDCHDFNDMWKIQKYKSAVLNAGDECSISHGFPSFLYDVSLSDSHNLAYQKYFHGSVLMVRIEGCLSHGATSGETQSEAAIDVIWERHHVVQYPGGADIIYLEIDDNPDVAVGTVQVSQLDTAQETFTR